MLDRPEIESSGDARSAADQRNSGTGVPRIVEHPNLRPFPKGQSGNPGCRKPDLISRAVREQLDEKTAADLVRVLIARALSGDLKAMELLWDRTEGKAIARTEAGDPASFTGIKVLRVDPDAL